MVRGQNVKTFIPFCWWYYSLHFQSVTQKWDAVLSKNDGIVLPRDKNAVEWSYGDFRIVSWRNFPKLWMVCL